MAAEEIDLNDEEEAALERAWARLEKDPAFQQDSGQQPTPSPEKRHD